MGDITTAMKNTYQSNFELLEQQMGSEMQDAVRRENIAGEYAYFDFIDSLDATEVVSRNANTVNEDVTYERRRISLRRFTLAPLIDKFDKIALIADPTSDILTDSLYAHGRQKDYLLCQAAFGTVATGHDGGTTTTYDAGNTVGVQYGTTPAGDTGLTVAKLRRARAILKMNNVSANEPWYFVCTEQQKQDLLGDSTVTSSDFNSVKALVGGEIDSFMGFKFIQIDGDVGVNPIVAVNTAERDCIAYAESGLMLGVGLEKFTDIQQRVDKNYSYQIFSEMWIGAIRTSEKKVCKVTCQE